MKIKAVSRDMSAPAIGIVYRDGEGVFLLNLTPGDKFFESKEISPGNYTPEVLPEDKIEIVKVDTLEQGVRIRSLYSLSLSRPPDLKKDRGRDSEFPTPAKVALTTILGGEHCKRFLEMIYRQAVVEIKKLGL